MRITGSLLAIGLAVGGALAPATLPDEPMRLAVIAPVTAPPTLTGVLDSAELAELTTPGGLLAVQLGQFGGREVTLGIDPMLLASIRALGSAAPEVSISWLTRLAEAPNETFALQWADANPVASLHAAGEVLDAPRLQIDPALFAPEGTDTIEVVPGDPVLPPLPDYDVLTAWAHSHESLAWPADHTMAESDLDGLERHGIRTVIVNSASVPATRVKSPHVAFGAVDGVVSNDIVSSLLRATIAAPTDEAWALSFAGLTSALEQLSDEGHTVLAATLGRIDANSPLRMSQTLDALHALDWVDLAPLSAVLEEPPVSSDFVGTPVDDERSRTIEALHRAEESVITFSSIIDNPLPLLETRRARLLALLSTGWAANDVVWQSGADQYLEESEGIVGAVTIQDSSTINLLAANGPFPVTVRNDLAHAVTVYITVRPDRPILNITDSRVELSIPANTQAKALVPVTVVANGHLGTTVTLASADRTFVSAPTRVELNVQAGGAAGDDHHGQPARSHAARGAVAHGALSP